jgi:hypothetical protein
MTTRLMLEHADNELFARSAWKVATPTSLVGRRSEETLANSVDHESLAAMSLSSLLYYALVEEREVADEFA